MNFGTGPLSVPVAIGVIALGVLVLAEWVIHLLGLHQPNAPQRERLSFCLCTSSWKIAVAYSLFDAFWLRWTTIGTALSCTGYAGVPLLVLGLAVRIVARCTLGKQFSGYVQTTDGHRLVTGGIYRRIRHPAYLGYVCLLLGFPIALGSLGGLAFAVVVGIPTLAYRMRIEEAALLNWFGEEYQRYRERTRRIIPWLW